MTTRADWREWIGRLPLGSLDRIDVALEGSWSETVRTVWRPGDAAPDLGSPLSHPSLVPSLELYWDGAWLGLHCYRRAGELNVLDEELARAMVAAVSDATTTSG